MRCRSLTLIVAVLVISTATLAADKVTVESKTVGLGATGVEIGIFIENDQALKSIVVPLVLRELNPGAFITALALDNDVAGSRVNGFGSIATANQYPNLDGNCKNNQPGGLGTPAPADFISPDGAQLGRQRIFPPDLPPGTDVIPSFMLTVDVAPVEGSFEIDTTCCDPACHLVFVTGSGGWVVPTFTKGVVNIVLCDCPYQCDFNADGFVDATDLAMGIEIKFFNAHDPQDPACPATRGDFNADGYADTIDLGSYIELVFFGGPPPVDPCVP